MAQIPKKVVDRFVARVGTFQKVLQSAKDRDVNESDTVVIVSDMLADVFGFDKYSDLTSEFAVRGTYCDLAIKLDGKVKFLIEVKAVGTELKDSHLKQVVDYGANHGVNYVVLTNGLIWQIHRIRFEQPIASSKICEMSMLDANPRKVGDQDKLFLLCKEGVTKAAIDEYHEHVECVNRFVIAAVIQSDVVVDQVRKELRRMAPGLRIETDEILDVMRNEVLKRDVLDGDEAAKATQRVRRSAGRPLRKSRDPGDPPEASQDVTPPDAPAEPIVATPAPQPPIP